MDMSPEPKAPRRYRASALVPFSRIADYIDPIVETIATHDMAIELLDGIHHIRSSLGEATFEPMQECCRLTAVADSPGALNQLKHALVGPIGFIAAQERLQIHWQGDEGEPAIPDELRILTVRAIEDLTPRLRRIVFYGRDLERYDRRDQLHCRLIFQPRGSDDYRWPMLDHRGHVVWPRDRAVPTRVYTIRRIDCERQELTIDFALHANAGPATHWALEARIGDVVGILGPAANGPKPATFHVLAGDETALPGIARILETLPDDAAGRAFIEVDGQGDVLPLIAPPGVIVSWLYRNGSAGGTSRLLEDAIRTVEWPQPLSACFFWGGCEHRAFSAIHRFIRRELGLPRDRMVLHSHWHRSLSEDGIIAAGAKAYLPD